jgi:hypothetical protein
MDLMQRTVSCVFPALDMYDLDERMEHCGVIKTLICLLFYYLEPSGHHASSTGP